MTLPNMGPPDVNDNIFFMKFPADIWIMVDRLLSNRDIKQLRLTCKLLLEKVHLRLERVFLSRSRLNIEVFLSIAHHHIFRFQVREIIYDSSLLVGSGTYEPIDSTSPWTAGRPINMQTFDEFQKRKCRRAKWLLGLLPIGHDTGELEECRRRLLGLVAEEEKERSTTIRKHWDHLQACIRDQDVLYDPYNEFFDTDVDLLRFGLKKFPSLRKITVTGDAYGEAPLPNYETPVIRAFPPNFNYPWVKCDLHGIDVALKALTRNDSRRRIELVVELGRSTHTLIGLGLDETHAEPAPSPSGPSSQGPALPVTMDGYEPEIALMLQLATTIKARKLFGKRIDAKAQVFHVDPFDDNILPPIQSLSSFASVEHFRLLETKITADNLVAVLLALPDSLRTVELMNVSLLKGSFSDVLQRLKDESGWGDRRTRPSLRIEVPHWFAPFNHWVEDEVNSFLYDEGKDPFMNPSVEFEWAYEDNIIYLPIGFVRFRFWPEFEVPAAYYAMFDMDGMRRVSEHEAAHKAAGTEAEKNRRPK